MGTGQVRPSEEGPTSREVIKVTEPGCSMVHKGKTRDNRDKQESFRYKEKPFHQEESKAME